MMMRELVENLKGIAGIGVAEDTILTNADKIPIWTHESHPCNVDGEDHLCICTMYQGR